MSGSFIDILNNYDISDNLKESVLNYYHNNQNEKEHIISWLNYINQNRVKEPAVFSESYKNDLIHQYLQFLRGSSRSIEQIQKYLQKDISNIDNINKWTNLYGRQLDDFNENTFDNDLNEEGLGFMINNLNTNVVRPPVRPRIRPSIKRRRSRSFDDDRDDERDDDDDLNNLLKRTKF